MSFEYDGGLQIWRKRLWIWRKADGRRMEAHNILTPSPSLLTLALFGIFGTKLICFTFCEPLHPARAQQKVLSILTRERYRWFDGISRRFDCVGYIPRISRVAIPMIPPHMWTRLLLHWQWNKPIFMHHLWTFWGSSLYWILNRVLWSRAPFTDPSLPPCWYLN